MVAKIAVSAATFAIDKPYSYWVPEGMELKAGMRVSVPFGRGNKRCEGVVLSTAAGGIYAGAVFLHLLRCHPSHAARRVMVQRQ